MRGFPSCRKNGFQDIGKIGVCGVAGVEFDEARGALWIKQKLERVLGGGFRGSERVKRRAGVNLEILSIARIFRRTRRNNF
jgi:hypothetical protein